MLTFFRKIRKALLDSGSLRRYLLYAVGEIALVVIGILIALQINNMNEERKDIIKEENILSELMETLSLNIERLDASSLDASNRNESRDVIISLFTERPAYTDSLQRHFFVSSLGYANSTLTHGGYEMLKNEGFDIIRSDKLRKEIVNLFEISYVDLTKEEMEKRSEVYVEDVARYLIENFSGRRVPNDYLKLLNDHFFVENIFAMKQHESWLISQRSEAKEETQRVLQLIRDELEE